MKSEINQKKNFTLIEYFDHLSPDRVYAGDSQSFITNKSIDINSYRNTNNRECFFTKKSPIVGKMYVDVCKDFRIISEMAFNNEENKENISDILLMVPMNMVNYNDEWPYLENKIEEYLDKTK